nr:hypothetical protein [Methylobacterium sp. Leaf122]
MNKATRWALRTLGGLGFLLALNGAMLLGAWALLHSVPFADPFAEQSASHYRRAIPTVIGITTMVAEGSDASLFGLFLPITREACGGVAFRLSDAAAEQIAAQGLAHLGSARIGRGYENSPEEHYFTYQPWQETPVPSTWIGDGKWAGALGCLKQSASQFDTDVVTEAPRQPGAFFTTGRESEILIIPRLRLLLLTYFG